MKTKTVIHKLLIIGALFVGLLNIVDYFYALNITNAANSGLTAVATVDTVSTMVISEDDIALDIVPSVEGTFKSAHTTVGTYANTNGACTVTMTTSFTDLVSGADSIATLSDAVSEANFTDDRWGFRIGSSGNYNTVETNNEIASFEQKTGSTAYNSDVYFAAKLTLATRPGTYSNTVTFMSTCLPPPIPAINTIRYMQDFATLTDNEMAEVLESMVLNQQYKLKDNRDEKEYYIAKLADGNVWMTQNLDHDIVTTENFYTYANTDIGHGSTLNTDAKWTAGAATRTGNDSNWSDYATAPQSYDPGDLCWNGVLGEYNLTTGTIVCGNDKHMHIGNYYDWRAAVAMNDTSTYNTGLTDADQSICPAGWRLPTYNGDKSFTKLITDLGLTAGPSGNVQKDPTYYVYSYGSSYVVGKLGSYWTSTASDGRWAMHFVFKIDGSISCMAQSGYRYLGTSVRCVAR